MKFQSAQNKTTVCEKCPQNFSKGKLSEIEGGFVVLPWLSHLFYLDSLRRVGASFGINDLTREEWDGLIMLEAVKAEVENEQMEKERRRREAALALERAKRKR